MNSLNHSVHTSPSVPAHHAEAFASAPEVTHPAAIIPKPVNRPRHPYISAVRGFMDEGFADLSDLRAVRSVAASVSTYARGSSGGGHPYGSHTRTHSPISRPHNPKH